MTSGKISDDVKSENKFRPGDKVVLKSDPSKGYVPVISVQPGPPETLYTVYIDGGEKPYYASQLEAYAEKPRQVFSADRFRAYLSSLEILYPGMSSLHSLNTARVDFIPYQYRPVLRFIRADRPRMLIADSVGVGKTIEAGLILRELQARKDINSILIICPKPLVTESKWKKEMKRFDEDFEHLGSGDLKFCIEETYINGDWPEKKSKAIVPYSKLTKIILEGEGRFKGLEKLNPPPRFDLVIVDEAHHIRHTNTYAYRAVKYFCENADAAIFLTATPIQLGDEDLFVLLNLLRPDLIIDRQSFEYMAEPNPHINRAVSAMRGQDAGWQKKAFDFLEQAEKTPWGQKLLIPNPGFTKVKEKLLRNEVTREERVEMISGTENLHTFSGIINRTRRRDIGDVFTDRKAETREIPFTHAQQELHDSLLKIQAKIFMRIHGDSNIAFMMTTVRRQAASCIFGLKPYLEEMLVRYADRLFSTDLLIDAVDDTFESDLDTSGIRLIEKEIEAILELARNLDESDPKFDELKRIITEKQKLNNSRVMLFSSFRHTLYYLEAKLKKSGFRVGLIHGGIPDGERVEFRKRFERSKEDPEAIDVLLFSEVGSEGLDYQFCDCLVNYDLPWNPMRIEQRIGRIDRNGQKSPFVVIYNMVTPGTVDFDIYKRCLLRIGVFEQSIGDCEQILGEITKEIKSIGEDFTLSEEQRQRKLEQLRDNEISRVQEMQRLEDEKYSFIGLRLPQEQLDKEINDAANFYLNFSSIEHLVNIYLRDIMNSEAEVILGKEPLKTLRLSAEVRGGLLSDLRRMNLRRNEVYMKWERWLRGSGQHLSVTFEAECAANNPDAAFLAPFHPLVRQAASHFAIKGKVFVNLKAAADKIKPGDYAFAVYRWHYSGAREERRFITITESDTVSREIDSLLREAKDCSAEEAGNITEQTINGLNARHHSLWEKAKREHLSENSLIVNYQKQSLETSHKARIAVLNERLRNASDERIKRMHQGEITKASADYERHLGDLEKADKKADIEFTPVVYGVLKVGGRHE